MHTKVETHALPPLSFPSWHSQPTLCLYSVSHCFSFSCFIQCNAQALHILSMINIYLRILWSASNNFTLNFSCSSPGCVDTSRTTQTIKLLFWLLIKMSIYFRRLSVVFCQGTQDNIDRGLASLMDKHMQLMYLVSKHAKLHKGRCGVMAAVEAVFCANWQLAAALARCHTFLFQTVYSLEQGRLARLDNTFIFYLGPCEFT